MVAAVAMDEPQMAPKPAQAAMVACASPPLRCPMKVYAAWKSSCAKPARATKLPIKMNRGMTDKVYANPVSCTTWAVLAMAGIQPRVNPIPTIPTNPMEKAKGMRIKANTKMAKNPSKAAVILCRLQRHCLHCVKKLLPDAPNRLNHTTSPCLE